MALPAILLALGLLLAAGGPAAAADADAVARQRALRLFDGEEGAGGLPVVATLTLPGEPEELAALEAVAQVAAGTDAVRAELRVWLVVPRLDGEPVVRRFQPRPQELGPGQPWLFRARVRLPDDFLEAAVVIEEAASGRWGAVIAELADEAVTLAEASGALVYEAPPDPVERAEATPPAVALRLLPPRRAPATGRVRFRTLVSDPLVVRVDFALDGRQAERDDEPPFTAVLELGPEPRPHRVEAIAFGPDGEELGRDVLGVNLDGDPFAVRIAGVARDNGAAEVAAEVRVPPESELEVVEFFHNQALVGRRERPPFRARFEVAEAGPADFVRVVARLADGRELEDARLMTAPAERVEVNLVELYAVVTDPEGSPVEGLPEEAFEVRLGGRPIAVERFGPAGQVPLVLGLIVDTSQSMEPLMFDTKQAGSRFLAEVMRPGDRSFLVDFDTRPRLAHGTTGEVTDLLLSFDRLRADGYTALYDAIIFSLLQFEGAEGRRALVLLTDGDDYRSRFGQGRCVSYGRELGVPVYIVGLAGILDPRFGLRKTDLEGITEATGGRIFYITSVTELDGAYAKIQAELRSQYLLAFSTQRALSRRELDSIQVRVRGKGLRVRAVVGGRRLD